MSEHQATIAWTRESSDFAYKTYNRSHAWRFEGGEEVRASAAPEYLGDRTRVNPEEALVASLSSCHMLTFLALAARRKLVVDRYTDSAVGYLEKNAEGRLAITRVELRPDVVFAPAAPSDEVLAALHHEAHEQCFIANSVRTQVTVLPPRPSPGSAS
jgi:organic hydroperoxide reductase OsmC/OhrA